MRTRLRAVLLAPFVATAMLGVAQATQALDHYVLALSWSPTFCEDVAPTRERLQCDGGRDYGFIVHGLWPNTTHEAPAYCSTDARRPTRRQVRAMLDIMPSPALVEHQWRKHGTCSGLSAGAYFDTLRRAFETVRVPPRLDALERDLMVDPEVLRQAFLRANPDLPEEAVTVRCRDGQLVDVRLCLTPALAYRACPAGMRRRSCASDLIEIPAPH